jgi:hypothetical protein
MIEKVIRCVELWTTRAIRCDEDDIKALVWSNGGQRAEWQPDSNDDLAHFCLNSEDVFPAEAASIKAGQMSFCPHARHRLQVVNPAKSQLILRAFINLCNR